MRNKLMWQVKIKKKEKKEWVINNKDLFNFIPNKDSNNLRCCSVVIYRIVNCLRFVINSFLVCFQLNFFFLITLAYQFL